jgi:hypothetical protein
MNQYCLIFYCSVVFHGVTIPTVFYHVDGQLNSFQFGAVMNKAAVHIPV